MIYILFYEKKFDLLFIIFLFDFLYIFLNYIFNYYKLPISCYIKLFSLFSKIENIFLDFIIY